MYSLLRLARQVLKYSESYGIKDLGNPQQRPMAYGRHKENSARVKHMKGDLGHVTHS